MTRNLLCPTCAAKKPKLDRSEKDLGYRMRIRYGVAKRAYLSVRPSEDALVSYVPGGDPEDTAYTCDTCSKDLTKGLPVVAVTIWKRSSGFYHKGVAPAWEHEYIEPLDADREENQKKWDALVERCAKISKRLKLGAAL